MSDDESRRGSPPEVIARFEEDFERCHPSTTGESTALVEAICAATRAENRAAAAQLVAIGALFAYRLSRCSDTEEWAIDTAEAVAAEVAAALRVSQHLAASRLRDARALGERLPQVGELFIAGAIDMRSFQTIVYRTELITDCGVLVAVDAAVAAGLPYWSALSLSRGRLGAKIDAIVARADVDAVRRRHEPHADRGVWIGERSDGLSQIEGTLLTLDAHALDQRLSALAGTVCPHDPRTTAQRRADALGALGAGADRLGCRCARTDCTAAQRPPAGPVTIHVIAEHATRTGAGSTPASEVSGDGLITAELIAELAGTATCVPLTHPGDTPPEAGYTPSTALAQFVRCRDLTCRWPGCERPAHACDLDHTIPHAHGGPTHAANLKCYCRTHHLVKTFWGWKDQQLPDGTLILTSPGGQTYITTPGSALLFPSLCHAVGGMPAPEVDLPADYCADRTAMMPTRGRTRTQAHAARVATQRHHNRQARHTAQATRKADDEPPPF